MTTDTVEEIRAEHESRHGSEKGQYRLSHAKVGVLLERIATLESASAAPKTARVRRGLGRALMVLDADLESIGKNYQSYGMSKAAFEDYVLAVRWISQQSR